ncbi:hypothetical protein EDC01DRAFT_732106 [Geopyxis carbonaria]|nr:hypothetical protein EDC01DRAFT_732106 [Geopyxis carbonaria]
MATRSHHLDFSKAATIVAHTRPHRTAPIIVPQLMHPDCTWFSRYEHCPRHRAPAPNEILTHKFRMRGLMPGPPINDVVLEFSYVHPGQEISPGAEYLAAVKAGTGGYVEGEVEEELEGEAEGDADVDGDETGVTASMQVTPLCRNDNIEAENIESRQSCFLPLGLSMIITLHAICPGGEACNCMDTLAAIHSPSVDDLNAYCVPHTAPMGSMEASPTPAPTSALTFLFPRLTPREAPQLHAALYDAPEQECCICTKHRAVHTVLLPCMHSIFCGRCIETHRRYEEQRRSDLAMYCPICRVRRESQVYIATNGTRRAMGYYWYRQREWRMDHPANLHQATDEFLRILKNAAEKGVVDLELGASDDVGTYEYTMEHSDEDDRIYLTSIIERGAQESDDDDSNTDDTDDRRSDRDSPSADTNNDLDDDLDVVLEELFPHNQFGCKECRHEEDSEDRHDDDADSAMDCGGD